MHYHVRNILRLLTLLPYLGFTNGILGGKQVCEKDRYPYMVAIYEEGADKPCCGGALIAENYILSANICFVANSCNAYRLEIGRYDLDDPDEDFEVHENPGVGFNLIYHPDYTQETATILLNVPDYDWLIFELADASNKTAVKINAPGNECLWPVREVTMLGFGSVGLPFDLLRPSVLKQAQIFTVPNLLCHIPYLFAFPGGRPTSRSMCIYNILNAPCSDDEGGPVIIAGDSPEEDLLVGHLSSKNLGCTNPLYPQIMARTNVDEGFDHILETTGGTITYDG